MPSSANDHRDSDHRELAHRHLDAQRELVVALPQKAVVSLHRRDLGRHAVVVLRVVGLGVLCMLALAQAHWPWLWPIAGLWQGSTILAFTILLHEVVHDTVLPAHVRRRAPWLPGLLRWAYALPAALSPSQFERWHLDHHAHLGSASQDPKRTYLSPRRNARWLKALYFTPALFFLYSRAASRAVATYPAPIARRIRLERGVAIGIHLALLTALVAWGGWWLALRVQLGPLLLAFPLWFAINRVGQHYDINPADPARWTTQLHRHQLLEFIMLWSNYHHEHHAFPGVPFYNLTKLHRLMRDCQVSRQDHDRGYRDLLWDWLIRNRAPHTRWTST